MWPYVSVLERVWAAKHWCWTVNVDGSSNAKIWQVRCLFHATLTAEMMNWRQRQVSNLTVEINVFPECCIWMCPQMEEIKVSPDYNWFRSTVPLKRVSTSWFLICDGGVYHWAAFFVQTTSTQTHFFFFSLFKFPFYSESFSKNRTTTVHEIKAASFQSYCHGFYMAALR